MDINIYRITEKQRNTLVNSDNGVIIFRPKKDLSGGYFISQDEFNIISNLDKCPDDLLFIKSLQPTVYEPVPSVNFS